jgi:hypothetical protein
MDVPTDASAVAAVVQAPGDAVTSLGTMGTRQRAIDSLIRKMRLDTPRTKNTRKT